MSARVLVTGGTSALGECVLALLSRTDAEVIALGRSESSCARLARSGVAVLHHDLDDPRPAPPGRADLILHVAGVGHAKAADEVARRWGCRSGVCVSSASATVEGHPLAVQVRSNESLLVKAVVDWRIVRPTMIFGSPRDRNIRLLARALHRLRACPRFSGGGQVQPVFVDDVAAVVHELGQRALAEDPDLPRLVSYGGTHRMTFGALVDDVRVASGLPGLPLRIPVGAMSGAVRLVGADHHSRVGHALSMLATNRVVPDPHQVGLRHLPLPWPIALKTAIARYREAGPSAPTERDAA